MKKQLSLIVLLIISLSAFSQPYATIKNNKGKISVVKDTAKTKVAVDTVKWITIQVKEKDFTSFQDLLNIGKTSPILQRSPYVSGEYISYTIDFANLLIFAMDSASKVWHPVPVSKSDSSQKKKQ